MTTRPRTALVVAGLAAWLAAGCSAPAQKPAPSPSISAPTVSAAQLCGYLEGRLPALKEAADARATLTTSLASWSERHGAALTGAQIDQLTSTGCPTTRTDVLTAAGIDSFATL